MNNNMLFTFGKLVATPGVLAALNNDAYALWPLLHRHVTGDWGECCKEDAAENDYSVDKHLRIFSVYRLPNDEKVWCITEADRSVTTFLLPEEY
jgi:hypothetical protein